MKKKLLSVLFAIMLIFAVPCTSFAAYGNTVSLGAQGNRSDLIYIKRPKSHSASTSDKTYTISAVGASGTKVKIYKYVPSEGTCKIIKAETTIGASGLYSTVVDLTSDSNTFVVCAESGSDSQLVKIQISKVKKSTIDKLKNVTVNVLNFIK